MGAVSERLEYRIASEPRGPAFEALLTWCAANGGYCSLVDMLSHSKKRRPAHEQFFDSAAPYLIAVENADHWPGGGVAKGTVPLCKYRLEPGLLDLLLAQARGLYSFQYPKLPEDLAVYRSDGAVLLASVAHEHLGWMYLTAEEKQDRRLGLVELQPTGRGEFQAR
jgi:hypothetical protein